MNFIVWKRSKSTKPKRRERGKKTLLGASEIENSANSSSIKPSLKMQLTDHTDATRIRTVLVIELI